MRIGFQSGYKVPIRSFGGARLEATLSHSCKFAEVVINFALMTPLRSGANLRAARRTRGSRVFHNGGFIYGDSFDESTGEALSIKHTLRFSNTHSPRCRQILANLLETDYRSTTIMPERDVTLAGLQARLSRLELSRVVTLGGAACALNFSLTALPSLERAEHT